MSTHTNTGDLPAPHDVAQAVLAACADLLTGARVVIGFAGESGSGKTETARAVAEALTAMGRPAALLHQDDYFKLPPATNHAHRELSFANVGPHEVDLARIDDVIDAFRHGAPSVAGQVVEYANDRFVPVTLDFRATTVLCVEGTYVLHLDGLDSRVFLAATHHDTRARREARARAASELTPFVAQVLEIEHRIISEQRRRADVVIDATFGVQRQSRADD